MVRTLFIIVFSFLAVQTGAQYLYGTARTGGTGAGGTIYRVNLDGTGITTEYNFQITGPKARSIDYGAMVLVGGGKMYGVASAGGYSDHGVLYEYDPAAGTFATKIEFDPTVHGQFPIGPLVQAPTGKLYGTASAGGVHGNGAIFEYDIASNSLTRKADFEKAVTGELVFGGLTMAANGKFYGVTFLGGANDVGVLFEYDYVNNVLTKKLDLSNSTTGGLVLRTLTKYTGNDKLYGLALTGGAHNDGTIFEYDPATNTATIRHDFDVTTNGKGPQGTLLEVGSLLYGATGEGGASNDGILFTYNPISGTFTKKKDFSSVTTGRGVLNVLTNAPNGKIYATTEYGGTDDFGVLFEYDPVGNTFTKHVDFTGLNGKFGKSGLTLAADSKLYGSTAFGGLGGGGTVFQFDPAGNAFETKVHLNTSTNGCYPNPPPILGVNGKLYGTATEGGVGNGGILYQFDPLTKQYSKKIEFEVTPGSYPAGALTSRPNGMLYGMTRDGGANGHGTIYEYDPFTNTKTKVFDFDVPLGRSPNGGLTFGSNGKFYGMTRWGGANDQGVIFEWNPTSNTYIKLFDLGGANGKGPVGDLVFGPNGNLYGLTQAGGQNDQGVLFECTTTGVFNVRVDFLFGTIGARPLGSLIKGSDGMLHGTTWEGGTAGTGTIFTFNPNTNTITNVASVDPGEGDGANPMGSLVEGLNNKYYATTNLGGTKGWGTLVEYSPSSTNVLLKQDFIGTNGVNPEQGALTLVSLPPTISLFAPTSAAAGASVTITGTNFSSTTGGNIVRFGPVRATVTSASATQLVVTVPHGAVLGPISVTVGGLTSESQASFNPTYSSNGWIPGSFASHVDLAGGPTPDRRSIMADFDGDGLTDGAMAENNSNNVHVFKNVSSPSSISFQAKVDFQVRNQPYTLAASDLDGDGKLDILAACVQGGEVSVLRNATTSGAITFDPYVTLPFGADCVSVTAADLDADGKPEVIAVGGSSDIKVFKNLSTPGNLFFAAAVNFPTGAVSSAYLWDVAAADIDGDLKPDLLVPIPQDPVANSYVAVFKNATTQGIIANNSFLTPVHFSSPGYSAGIDVADLDGDSKPELIIGSEPLVSALTVRKNVATQGVIDGQTFGPAISLPTILNVWEPEVADVNGDGKPDIVAAWTGGGRVLFFVNQITGGSITPTSFSKYSVGTGGGPLTVSVGDLNMDGLPDLAIANEQLNQLQIFKNTNALPPPSISSFTASAAVGSTVTISGSNFSLVPANNTVYFGPAKATVTAATASQLTVAVPAGASYGPISVTTNGLNATSATSFAPAFVTSGIIDANSFTSKIDITTGQSPQILGVADFDIDGKSDIAIANITGNSVSVMRNTSTAGTVSLSKLDFSVGQLPYGLAVGDLDGDGKQDIVATNINSQSISIFRNTSSSGSITSGSFAAKVDIGTGGKPFSVTLGDLDADGRLDIAVTRIDDGIVSLFKNLCSPGTLSVATFASRVDVTTNAQPSHVSIADLDGNQKPELVVSNLGTSATTISIFRNNNEIGTLASVFDKTDLTVGVTPYSTVVTDFDADGKPDIAATTNTGVVALFRNKIVSPSTTIAPSSFDAAVSYVIGASSNLVTISDLDGDKKPDIIASDDGAGAISILKNKIAAPGTFTAASFQTKVELTANALPRSVGAADLDGDGKPELMITSESANAISIYRNLGQLGVPSLNTATNITTTSLDLSWTSVNGAADYRLDISADNFATNLPAYNNLTVAGTSKSVTGLTPGTGYKFRVRASNVTGVSGNSTEGSALMVPDSPIATAATEVTMVSFTATWSASVGAVDYFVDVSKDDFTTTPAGLTNVAVTGLSQSFSGLVGGAIYKFRVRARNATGTSVSSNVVTVPLAPLPVISDFIPKVGNVGTVVNIVGSHFDPVPANNIVLFNTTQATNVSIVSNGLNATVPTGATTGKITVTVAGQSVQHTTEFVIDTTPPDLQDNSSSTVNQGQEFNVLAKITDAQSAITASFSYRALSSNAAMIDGIFTKSGDDYTGKVPTTSIGENGLEYVIKASSAGGAITEVTKVVKINVTGDGLVIKYDAFGETESSYRIISVPLELTDKTVAGVFEDDLGVSTKKNWRLTRYGATQDTELTSASTIEPKLGYWLIVKSNPNKPIDTGPGTSITTTRNAPVEIQLSSGWNQIGNPYNFAIVWSEIIAANPGVVISKARTYDGQWGDATVVASMSGMFINSPSSQVLKFPVLKNSAANPSRIFAPSRMKSLADENWELPLVLIHDSHTNTISGIGMNKAASEGLDVNDGLTMPRFFSRYLELNHKKRQDGNSYSMDVVPSSQSHEWEFVVESNYEGQSIAIEWDNSVFGDNNKTLVLWDDELQLASDMRKVSRYEFPRAPSRRFKIFFGDIDEVMDRAVASKLVFHSIYPNPTDDDATVAFSTPSEGVVHVDLVDMLGRTHWSSSSNFSKGFHQINIPSSAIKSTHGMMIVAIRTGEEITQKRLQIK